MKYNRSIAVKNASLWDKLTWDREWMIFLIAIPQAIHIIITLLKG